MTDETVVNPVTCPSCGAGNPGDNMACASCGTTLQGAAPTSFVVSVDLKPGTVFHGRYEIIGPLGKGGMGMVLKARDRTLEEVVAIKILRPDFAQDPKMAERFKSEIRLARKIRHRNVCGIHDFGEDRGLLYISMELIEGVDLKKVLVERGALPAEEAYDIAIQIAEGLQSVHEAGIVHRDLKTPNVMRDLQGVARLMDFGIAKRIGDGTATATGQIVGTPEYMSPEQAQGHKLDARSDVYALGIVVWELFTGHVPFRAETPIGTILKHINEPPPLDGPEAAKVPAPLKQVLRRALAKDRNERYASARDMAEALRQARTPSLRQQALPTEVLRAPTLPMQRKAGGGFRAMHAWLLVVPLVAIAGGVALTMATRGTPPSTIANSLPSAAPATVVAVPTMPPETTLLVAPSVQPLEGVPRATVTQTPPPRPTPEPRRATPPPPPTTVPAPPPTTMARAVVPVPVPVTTTPARPEPAGPGELQVVVKPWGEVWVDGKALGSTPLDKLTLPSGSHRVRVRHPAYDAVERDVVVRAGQTERLVIDFTGR